jgi:hypothetical protein
MATTQKMRDGRKPCARCQRELPVSAFVPKPKLSRGLNF